MRETEVLTALEALNCRETSPDYYRTYFTTGKCKLYKNWDNMKIWSLLSWPTRENAHLIARSPLLGDKMLTVSSVRIQCRYTWEDYIN